eukprot:355120-Chlamydomonas_euryale.AAC.2
MTTFNPLTFENLQPPNSETLITRLTPDTGHVEVIEAVRRAIAPQLSNNSTSDIEIKEALSEGAVRAGCGASVWAMGGMETIEALSESAVRAECGTPWRRSWWARWAWDVGQCERMRVGHEMKCDIAAPFVSHSCCGWPAHPATWPFLLWLARPPCHLATLAVSGPPTLPPGHTCWAVPGRVLGARYSTLRSPDASLPFSSLNLLSTLRSPDASLPLSLLSTGGPAPVVSGAVWEGVPGAVAGHRGGAEDGAATVRHVGRGAKGEDGAWRRLRRLRLSVRGKRWATRMLAACIAGPTSWPNGRPPSASSAHVIRPGASMGAIQRRNTFGGPHKWPPALQRATLHFLSQLGAGCHDCLAKHPTTGLHVRRTSSCAGSSLPSPLPCFAARPVAPTAACPPPCLVLPHV